MSNFIFYVSMSYHLLVAFPMSDFIFMCVSYHLLAAWLNFHMK
jgi:hypothetical protein